MPSLRILVTGGEAPFPTDIETYAGRHQYFNAYGPTENTITSTMRKLSLPATRENPLRRPPPARTPAFMSAIPEGNSRSPRRSAGELWLGGAGPGPRLCGTDRT